MKNVIGLNASAAAGAGGRSAIKHPGTNSFSLYLLIAPTTAQLCSSVAGPNSKVTQLLSDLTNICGVTTDMTATYIGSQTVVHIIANPNAL